MDIQRFLRLTTAGAALAASSMLVSCDEPAVEPVMLFELEVQSSYPSALSDHWVVVSDMSGAPLGSASFESGETVEVHGIAPESNVVNIMLVIFTPSATSINDRDYYFFNSYKDVPVGDKWHLKRAPGLSNLSAGKVDVHIANLPGNNSDLSISSFNRRNEVTASWAGPVFNVQVGLRKSPSDLFFSLIDATPRYLQIDANAGQDLTFDYQTDFVPFDKVLPITFNVSNLVVNIQGFNTPIASMLTADINYHTQSIYTGVSSGIKVGYNDGYSFYQTSWNANFPGGRRVAYFKLGDPPATATFDPRFGLDFTINDNTVGSFDVDVSPEFNYCINEYFAADELSENKPVTTWQIARPVSSLEIPLARFPDEMVERYPYLASVIAIVNYQRSTFVQSVHDGEYHHYLEERFRSGEFRLYPRETFSLTK